MFDTFLATLTPMLVMLVCILIGFALRKAKLAPDNAATVMSKLEVNVFMPAQVLHIFIANCTVESITTQYSLIIYGTITVTAAIIIGVPLARMFAKEENLRAIYRYGLVFANCGFLGLSIVPQIMGDSGAYAYMLFVLPVYVALYGWGISTLIPSEGGKKEGLLKRLANPTMVAMVLGAVLGLLGAKQWLPKFITTTTQNISGCVGPVAMILTGFVIGGYHIPSLLKNVKVYIITVLRLIVIPAILVGILWLTGADGVTMRVAMFAFASALGLNTVVIPAAYGADTTTAAAMAMVSHVGAVITIPVLYSILLHIA